MPHIEAWPPTLPDVTSDSDTGTRMTTQASSTMRGSPATLTAGLGVALRNVGFPACVLLLVGLVAAFHTMTRNVYFRKEALPIKKSLDMLDRTRLAPYEVVRKNEIESETLNALGTREYIQWDLVDTSVQDRSAPERFVNLFITYYTGQPDPVPHVPEACYSGSGLDVEYDSFPEFAIPGLKNHPVIRVHMLRFPKTALLSKHNLVVVYVFKANGAFTYDRNSTRREISNPKAKYAYFSKVEVKFGQGDNLPSEDVAVAAAHKLFKILIPLLQQDHWPDWDPEIHAPGG